MSHTRVSLTGKVVAVTGAARSLGLEFARALTREGAELVMLGRPSAEFEAAKAEMPDAMAQDCDVASSESVAAAFTAIAQRHGRLDALVNNAAALYPSMIEEITDDHIAREVGANLIGPMMCIRAAIPLLRAAGGGDIVNISSMAIESPRPFFTLYSTTKAGLENMSACLATELRPDKIRVLVLRSGSLTGGQISRGWPPELKERIARLRVESGLAAQVGEPISPTITAETLLHILTMPREARLGDVVVVRPS